MHRPLLKSCHPKLLQFAKRRFTLSANHNSHLQIWAQRSSRNAVVTRAHRPRMTHENLLPSISLGGPIQQVATVMNGHGPAAEMAVEPVDQSTFTPEQEALFQEQQSLAIVKELDASPDWFEVVAYGHMSDSARARSLTASSLRGEGKIALRPLKFFNKDKTQCVIIAHLGRNLCGHEGIIHGGLLATLLDEHLAYVSLPSLPNYTGFTANLSIDYRKPCKADQWVVIRGKLDRVEGRKAYANAWVETASDGTLLTEASALYVSPRMDGPPRQS